MRRTAVTGIGVVAPGGVTRDAFWKQITAGRTGTRKITFFDPQGFRSQIAAEADFDPRAAAADGPRRHRAAGAGGSGPSLVSADVAS